MIVAAFAYIGIDAYLAALAFQHWISGSSENLDYSFAFEDLRRRSAPSQAEMKSYCSSFVAYLGCRMYCIEQVGYYTVGVGWWVVHHTDSFPSSLDFEAVVAFQFRIVADFVLVVMPTIVAADWGSSQPHHPIDRWFLHPLLPTHSRRWDRRQSYSLEKSCRLAVEERT